VQPRERIALWVLVSVTALGLIVNTVILSGELADLRRQVAYAVGAQPDPTATELPSTLPDPEENVGDAEVWGSRLTVRALGAQRVENTTVISLTVRGFGAADPLMDLPLLICDEQAYEVAGESLERARQELLALITQGTATTTLRFTGNPNLAGTCAVLLNPQQDVDSPVAPRIEVPIPQQAPTPTSEPEAPEAKQQGGLRDAVLVT
jgi:hypothetical protein